MSLFYLAYIKLILFRFYSCLRFTINIYLLETAKKKKKKTMSKFWDFRIEHKVFVLHLSNDAGSVMISERTRFASFEMKIGVADAVWMKNTLNEALVKEDAGQFLRKYRASNFVLIAERYFNQRGVFMKFSQVCNGGVRNIIVPEGRSLWGWNKLTACLDNIVGRRLWKGGQPSKVSRSINPLKVKYWKTAITIYRNNTRLSWEDTNRKVESIIKRKSEVCQVAADRVILWCLDEQELRGLLLRPEQLSSYKTVVSMRRWRKEDHWENLKIGVRYSWIGIEWIPLTMWDIHVFKVLGAACGGFLEVAEETINKSHLGFAKIKVKGFESGMIYPVIEISCDGERVCLGVFSFKNLEGDFRGYCNAGPTTRAIVL